MGGMGMRAVGVDLGGVLERLGEPEEFLDRWRVRLRLSREDFYGIQLWPLARAAVDVDGGAKTGRITEAGFREQCAAALSLTSAQAGQFMADFWDWYCGELDAELASYVACLRPRYRTGILSNSLDGARREEQARFGLDQLVDVVVYSHEIGVAKPDPRAYLALCEKLGVAPQDLVFLDNRAANVDAASQLGIHALLYTSTPESIAAIDALLCQGQLRPRESIRETLDILSDEETLADLQKSTEDFAVGDTFESGQVRAELEHWRSGQQPAS
jgi:epoxide hydrolase-like predicted phosphatase